MVERDRLLVRTTPPLSSHCRDFASTDFSGWLYDDDFSKKKNSLRMDAKRGEAKRGE